MTTTSQASMNESTAALNPQRNRMGATAKATPYFVIGAIILSVNLVAIVTFTGTRFLRKRRSSYLLISLSIADSIVGVSTLMMGYVVIYDGHVSTEYMATLESVDFFGGLSSIFTLASISMERFFAVLYPFKHRQFRGNFYIIIGMIPWCFAAFSSIFRFFYRETRLEELLLMVDDCVLVITLATALLTIVVCYISIALKMRFKNHMQNCSYKTQRRIVRDQKLAVTLCGVTVASLVTWCPYMVTFAAGAYFGSCCSITPLAFYLLSLLRYLNSGINVFFYIAKIPEFRAAFLLLMRSGDGYGIKDRLNTGISNKTSSPHNSPTAREARVAAMTINMQRSGKQENSSVQV